MITIEMTGMCAGCRRADLELSSTTDIEHGRPCGVSWSVKCRNEALCNSVYCRAVDESIQKIDDYVNGLWGDDLK